jgi:hypothetical protein
MAFLAEKRRILGKKYGIDSELDKSSNGKRLGVLDKFGAPTVEKFVKYSFILKLNFLINLYVIL